MAKGLRSSKLFVKYDFAIALQSTKANSFQLLQALYASKIVSYAQGFMLLREAAKQYNWTLNYGGIALMWRGGCIIRRWQLIIKQPNGDVLKNFIYLCVCVFSVFLGNIKLAFERNPDLKSLLLDDFFRQAVGNCQESWRDVIATAAKYGVPVPAFSTALSFYDAYRCQRLPANLIQVNIQLKVGFIEENIP